VDLDFKEDQMAIEAYVRMRSGWRDVDGISDEEYIEYAFEYMEEHPFESWLVIKSFEALIYDRVSGEFSVWRKLPGVHIYWQPGAFWSGVRASWDGNRESRRENPSRLRLLGEYFGLVEPAKEN